ncbi:TolC family protein [Kiritimatiella glycovorans]|nr:TolC family protein [Kiritimatiella glycovorans]
MIRSIVFFIMSVATCAAGRDSLDWEACVRLAEQHHPRLVAAQASVRAAQAGTDIAESSTLPQLSVSGSGRYSESGGAGVPATGRESYGADFGVSQNLYSGGENRARIDSARAGLEAAIRSYEITAAEVTLDLRRAFIELLYAQQQVALNRGILDRLIGNEKLVELRYEGGREHKGSLALSRATTYEGRTDLAQAERQRSIARENLARTIGLDHVPPALAVTGAFEVDGTPVWSGGRELARATPEFSRRLALLDQSEADLRSAESGLRPDLDLTGSAGRAGEDLYLDEYSWSAGVRLSFPFWSGGRERHRIRQAEAGLLQAEAEVRNTLDALTRTLADAYRSYADAAENVEVRTRFLEASELRASIARRQYESGLLSFENWDIIESNLIQNRKQLLQSQRTALIAAAQWTRVRGLNAFDRAAVRRKESYDRREARPAQRTEGP